MSETESRRARKFSSVLPFAGAFLLETKKKQRGEGRRGRERGPDGASGLQPLKGDIRMRRAVRLLPDGRRRRANYRWVKMGGRRTRRAALVLTGGGCCSCSEAARLVRFRRADAGTSTRRA